MCFALTTVHSVSLRGSCIFSHNISMLFSLNVGKYAYYTYIAVMCGTIFTKLGTDVMSLEDVRTP
jgi:hypothetical protein